MSSKRIIIVSNRLPYRMEAAGGRLDFLPSSGGLVSGIKSLINGKVSGQEAYSKNSIHWIGASDISEKKFSKYVKEESVFHEDFFLHPVFIPPKVYNNYYNGFCNDVVWPLFHYFPSFASYRSEYFDSYVQANRMFCGRIAEHYKPGDVIWVHDYHLMLLPAMLRQVLPDAFIGFFLHIPFPSFELFRMLPALWRKDILNGLLGADLVGFQTNDYVQHFIKSVQRLLGYSSTFRQITTPDRSVIADSFPISIDYKRFSSACGDAEIYAEKNEIKKKLHGMKIIVSVDRLDYAKGLINRLKGFELFLEQFPEYLQKVTYILVVVPSRDVILKYKEIKSEIEKNVSRINGKFGGIHWIPVVYQYQSLDFKKLCALYLSADIALITPLRDGMNLVAKEFIASRFDKKGVLILSETAGVSFELGESILVNPNDLHAISAAIKYALEMPVALQGDFIGQMQKRLEENDIHKWGEDFMRELEYARVMQDILKVKELIPGTEQKITDRYFSSVKRLIFLDYDGTLSPLVRDPEMAVPSQEVLELLEQLGADPRNTVVIISGRQADFLDKCFSELPVCLAAEHGGFVKLPGEKWQQMIKSDTYWKQPVLKVFEMFSERCQGSIIEEKQLSVAWHYRDTEHELGFLRSRELFAALEEVASFSGFQVIEGSKVIEARARGIDKGNAAALWIDRNKYDFILAIGDDKTDEDLFKAVPADQFTIRVGFTPSFSRYNFRKQSEVIRFLKKLILKEVVD